LWVGLNADGSAENIAKVEVRAEKAEKCASKAEDGAGKANNIVKAEVGAEKQKNVRQRLKSETERLNNTLKQLKLEQKKLKFAL
jgi:maltooligosyltrehalose synthase